jgi:hypothetical protein
MRILPAFIMFLLVFPAVAEARPVCGPSKARTLAKNGDARLYTRSGRTYGCARGHRPLALGAAVRTRRLAGHFAAVVNHRRLTVYDLRKRRVDGKRRLNTAGSKVRGVGLSDGGVAVWIEDRRDGTRVLQEAEYGPRDSGRNLQRWFVHIARGTIAYRKGDYVKFAMSHAEGGDPPRTERPRALYASPGRIGKVELSTRAVRLYARYGHGPRVELGMVIDDGLSGNEGSWLGIGALRIAGTMLAARENSYMLGVADGRVTVFDLKTAAAPRLACEAVLYVTNFVVTTDGAVACITTGEGNQIVSEGTVLDEGDARVTDLDIRDGRLVWKHGGQTRTAPLPRRS